METVVIVEYRQFLFRATLGVQYQSRFSPTYGKLEGYTTRGVRSRRISFQPKELS